MAIPKTNFPSYEIGPIPTLVVIMQQDGPTFSLRFDSGLYAGDGHTGKLYTFKTVADAVAWALKEGYAFVDVSAWPGAW